MKQRKARPMTPRQRCFVEAYARLKNGKAAAREAGYGARAAAPMASKMLRNPEVQKALIERGVAIAFSSYGPKRATRVALALSERQERFVQHYLALGRAAEAARRAGYSPRSAPSIADKLLNTPRVAAAISSANAARAKALAFDAERVLEEFAAIAFADLRHLFDWDEGGLRLREAALLDPAMSAAIAAIEAQGKGEGQRVKVKLHDKPKALLQLARYLGLFTRQPRPSDAPTVDGRDPREVLRERLARLIGPEKEN
jgi:phage terminase small subunit